MELPDGYLDALTDELAPFGFEFGDTETEDDGQVVRFHADPESFAHEHPDAGVVESYGSHWPPARLHLVLRIDRHGDPYELAFENLDLLADTASEDPQLHSRLNTLEDPEDQASAVGEALAAALRPDDYRAADFLE